MKREGVRIAFRGFITIIEQFNFSFGPPFKREFILDRKLEEELDDSSHMNLGGFKPGSEIKPGENKSQETIQMPMSFSKVSTNLVGKIY